MTVKTRKFNNVWAGRASLVIALLIMVISWLNHGKISYAFLQGFVSLAVMYLLLAGSWYLFKKGGPPEEEIGRAHV